MRRSALTLVYAVTLVPLAITGTFWHHHRESSPEALTTAAPAAKSAARRASAEHVAWYAAAGEAFRTDNLEAVRAALTELAASHPGEAARSRVVGGLYELAAGEMRGALDTLSSTEGLAPELEDWRLYGIAEAAAFLGQHGLADQALNRLLTVHPDSSLGGRAVLNAAELAWQAGDGAQALSLVTRARDLGISGETATSLESLAWKVAEASRDSAAQREAARQLLIHSPMTTWQLDITSMFRDPRGQITSWDGVLSSEEVLQRADAWMAAGRPLHAQRSLQTIPSGDRNLRWEVQMARALTAQGKGRDAYERLRTVRPSSAEELAQVEWERATAAATQASPRRGEPNPTVAERERLLQVSQRHLRRLVELSPTSPVPVASVRRIHALLAEHGPFEENIEVLSLLRQLDPSDRTGASFLWERGWREFLRDNFTGAVNYWSHLEELYPDDRESHRGRYWKARALEAMGEDRRAREAFRTVVRTADTVDFYGRQAAARLGGELPVPAAGSTAPSWPEDARLARVLLLADLGLTPLARLELDQIASSGTVQAASDIVALRGILEVREGRPRQGVIPLRAAFPALGGPYQATVPLPVLEAYYPLPFAEAIRAQAKATGVPASMVAGIIRQESAFDPRAESWAGARGLMQLMPATAREWSGKLGEGYSPARLFDPELSIRLGTHYFRWVLERFDGNVELALAGYNGGPNRIRRLWNEAGGPETELDLFVETLAIRESQDYVKRILVLADSYQQIYPDEPSVTLLPSS